MDVFKEEGLERAVIRYMKNTGVGFEVRVGGYEQVACDGL